MLLINLILPSALLALSVSSLPFKRSVDPTLVPAFGFEAGVNPTGTGDCDGAVDGADGKPIKIPCACPPDRDSFIASLNANVDAGHAVNNPPISVSFPSDSSVASQITRIQAALVSLQNLHGPGVGCPASSTTFVAQQKALQDGGSVASSPAVVAAAPAPTASTAAGSDDATVESLAPDLGFSSGINPTGTGDCDGAVDGADGKPIKIPCACPPARAEFISQLEANVAAGFAVHNPSVAVTYPLDDSVASQSARITASLITVQNLNGPGQGCPAVSTTLQAQQKALQ